MPQFNIAEAKANLSSLVKKALQGEEVIIAKDNKPLLRLSPILPNHSKGRSRGLARTKFSILLMILIQHLKDLGNMHNTTVKFGARVECDN